MGFFDRLFNRDQSENEPQPNIRFGRYSDSYKTAANYKAWDVALEKFEKEDYLDCYDEFFKYLRDEEEDNVKYWRDENGIRFEIYQGSKKITGFADDKKLKAEAKVAHTESLNVGFMRRLIEQNFALKYSRFALDEDKNITIVFDTYNLDGSPYKLYYALKEVATNADKQDDLLLDEFQVLLPVDTSHLELVPDPEKEIKYNYIHDSIAKTLNEMETGSLSEDQYPGAMAYLLLNLVYKLDYLIKPEGYMMETLERIHRLYFAKDGKTTAQKNQLLVKQLKKLKERPKDNFFKEMYRIKSTFGITTPVNHDKVVSFIDSELNNMDWYRENGHDPYALAVPGYIVGYSMFNYAVPKPDRDLFHLYFQIIVIEYFQELGFTYNYYDPKEKKLNKKAIKRAIDRIVDENKDKYYKLSPSTSSLQFDSLMSFTKSYLLMIRNLDLTKLD